MFVQRHPSCHPKCLRHSFERGRRIGLRHNTLMIGRTEDGEIHIVGINIGSTAHDFTTSNLF